MKGSSIGIALAMISAAAIAQRADPPEVKVGDRWQFVVYYTAPSTTPNRTWVVTSVTPTRIEGTENDGEALSLTPELNIIDTPRERTSNMKMLSFPLEVGKSWRYESDWLFKPKGSKGTFVGNVTVVGYERIKVPAGEFEAFKLVDKRFMRGISGIGSVIDAEASLTYWYAPAANAIVKAIHANPYLGPSTIELVEYRPKR
jgi:hypothetical protein